MPNKDAGKHADALFAQGQKILAQKEEVRKFEAPEATASYVLSMRRRKF